MSKSIFDPKTQQSDVSSKIVAGLERISGAFKVLLWEKAKELNLSPIQIQILIFISYHKSELANVSHLAKEFNISKATVSDAISTLNKKKLVSKNHSTKDHRAHIINLTSAGKKVANQVADFAEPLKQSIDTIDEVGLGKLFETMTKVISLLNKNGILTVQRTCYGCKYYQKSGKKHYCNLLEKELATTEIRLDCDEFEQGDH